jgi:hypothetical protein
MPTATSKLAASPGTVTRTAIPRHPIIVPDPGRSWMVPGLAAVTNSCFPDCNQLVVCKVPRSAYAGLHSHNQTQFQNLNMTRGFESPNSAAFEAGVFLAVSSLGNGALPCDVKYA